jgi:outer membrane protein OmpA-like peptidoglycan-associated protein
VVQVHPVVSVDDRAVLTVDYSVPEDSESSTSLSVGWFMTGWGVDLGTTAVRLVDLEGGRVWAVGSGSLWRTTTNDLVSVGPGQSKTSQTFFGPVDADSVDVMLPLVGLVPDVPVIKGDATTPDVASLGIDGPFEFPDPYPLEAFIEAFDGEASVRQKGDQQTVTLASDVLFASDDSTLSAEAIARVDATAQQIAEVAAGGEVRVVGHTDDVDTDEYNLALSDRRAQSVAERLSVTLGSSFTFVVEGKGKREPAVEGTSAAARAANRRVEIGFAATEVVQLTSGGQTVPEPTGPTVSGHGKVEYTLENNTLGPTTVRVAALSVLRYDGYLIGSMEVTVVAGKNLDYLLGDFELTEQNYGNTYLNGAWDVALLGPSGRVYPVQYRPDPGSTTVSILADQYRWIPIKPGESFTYTVVWPDTGQDKVSVDVRNRFRITDIPVEEK